MGGLGVFESRGYSPVERGFIQDLLEKDEIKTQLTYGASDPGLYVKRIGNPDLGSIDLYFSKRLACLGGACRITLGADRDSCFRKGDRSDDNRNTAFPHLSSLKILFNRLWWE